MQKEILSKVGRRLLRPVRLYGLWQSEDPYLQRLASSAQAALRDALTVEERAWVERIEALRAELSTSTEKVVRTDFGAGLRDAVAASEQGRTVASPERAAGVEVHDEVRRIAAASSKSRFWALFLFKLLRELRPARCLEMGTALGLSGAYQAAALALNGNGQLTSLEGSAALAVIARRNWQRLGLDNAALVVGKFDDTLAAAASAAAPVDYVFIDGHHDERATLDYYERLLPYLASPACLVFDDIKWSEGMRRAWRAIARDERTKVSVDFGPLGVAFVGSLQKRRPRSVALA